jgi:hypothetical protein
VALRLDCHKVDGGDGSLVLSSLSLQRLWIHDLRRTYVEMVMLDTLASLSRL